MKKLLIMQGIIVFSIVCIAIFKDKIIQSVVTSAASKVIGAQVHMDGFSLDILSSTIRISGLKAYNPSGFPEGILVFFPTINVIYDPATIFKHKRHYLFMEIELKEMGLAKNKEGKLNVESIKIAQQTEALLSVPMQLDFLSLSIGKIVYKDYTISTEPSVRVYNVNRHNTYKNIPNAKQLGLLVFGETIKFAPIKTAGLYGVAMLTGVSVLRVAGETTLIGKDDVQEIIDASFEHVYEVSLKVAKRMGTITKDNASEGAIKANILGAMAAIQLRKSSGNKTEITISARKYMFPKLDIAGGILYQILDKLQS